MFNAKTAIAKTLVIATALAAFAPSMAKAAVLTDSENVTFSATVANSVTLDVDTAAMEFGTLSSSAATWADASAGNASFVKGNTFTVGSNSTNGVSLTYTGNTLTSAASDTISGIGGTGVTSSAGSEQFGLAVNSTSLTENSEYQADTGTPANSKYAFNSTDSIASTTGPISGTVDAYYIANIAALTEAGSYSTTLTFTATSTF